MNLKTRALIAGGVACIGGGVVLGLNVGSGHQKQPDTVVVTREGANASPSATVTRSVSRKVEAPAAATVKQVPAVVQQAPVGHAAVPQQQQEVQDVTTPTDPSSQPPTTDPTPTDSTPIQEFSVTPDSDGRAGMAPPPAPAPTQQVAPPTAGSQPNAVPTPAATPSAG